MVQLETQSDFFANSNHILAWVSSCAINVLFKVVDLGLGMCMRNSTAKLFYALVSCCLTDVISAAYA